MRSQSHLSPVQKLVDLWQHEPDIQECIVQIQDEAQRAARLEPFPTLLHPDIIRVMQQRGIQGLYSHQALALDALQHNQNVVVVTGTASGKTLCYNLPAINQVLSDPESCTLYLFPTKALTQDQHEGLKDLLHAVYHTEKLTESHSDRTPAVAVYDGDTPSHQRAAVREQARFLMTNPDMLHLSILPHHTLWAKFFQNLKFVVIDELHTYRGIFGSHIANVIRRLKRIANFYGADPRFILTSATIANPKELAERLIEQPVTQIDQDGSPRSERHFVLFNPPVINPDLGIRRGASSESVRLTAYLLNQNIQTILFTRSRRGVELILKDLLDQYPQHARQLFGYRSGYLASERRSIERSLRDGSAKVVVATNALELGIDVGGMGAILMIGYPGSITATRQQAGRAGRRDSDALAVLVASAAPVDQFLMKHTDYLFGRSPEKALINPNNLLILIDHVRCAAFELPFRQGESFGDVPETLLKGLLQFLVENGVLHFSGSRYFWMANQYPANEITLRTAAEGAITLQAWEGERWVTIGEVDQPSAMWMVHPQAIYLHGGESYCVDTLDLDKKVARMLPSHADYFTEPHKALDIEKISVLKQTNVTGGEIFYGEILAISQVTGYQRVQWPSRQNLGEYPLDMPKTELNTVAYWLTIGEDTVAKIQEAGLWKNEPNQYGANWPMQRKMARMRDKFICQACGAPEDGEAHHVHHKIPFKVFDNYQQANHLDNLITLCPSCHRRAEAAVRVRSSLAGLAYVMSQLAPLFLMCDLEDLGVYYDPQAPIGDQHPTIVLYDQAPAGIGLAEEIYRIHDELIHQAYDLVSACACTDGCPSCVGPAGENGYSGKKETLALIEALLNKKNG